MNRSLLRLLPAVLALAVITFAALASAPRAREAAPSAAELVGCNAGALAGATTAYSLATNGGVYQPFDYTVPFVSCTLAMNSAYTTGTFSIRAWDPATLAPDPTMIALRSRGYTSSDLVYNHVRADYTTPIVVESVPGVAEAMRTTLVADYKSTYLYNTTPLRYWTDGPADMPAGIAYGSAAGAQPAGPHPVFGLSLCPAEGASDKRVLQSVLRASTMFGYEAYEYLQRFRVPAHCTLEWIEAAFGPNGDAYPWATGLMAVVDGEAMPVPDASVPAAIFQADFYQPAIETPTFATHYQTAAPVSLEPDHDYWLIVRAANKYPLLLRNLDGSEGPDFTSGIGPLYSRATPAGEWTQLWGRALNFRLVGTPSAPPVAVEPAVRTGLRLGVEPNPARGAALVRWSGAKGAVRVEVIDPRGRRVAAHEAGAAEGTWLWRGTDDRGEALAPGVYFVRAADDAGTRGLSRVVLVR